MLNPFKYIFRSTGVLITTAFIASAFSIVRADSTGNGYVGYDEGSRPVSDSTSGRSQNPPELSEKIGAGITALQALFDAKQWDDAIKAIDGMLAKPETKNYDRAFLCQIKAQILGSKGDYTGAIEPLETALKIADNLHLFRFPRALPISEQDTLINLASLNLQEASSTKVPTVQRAAFAKAHAYGRRLVDVNKPTIEAQTMWARILYSEATMDQSKIDLALMKQAVSEAEKALYLVINPKEENYTLFLASLQQLGDNPRAAELLELLVKKFPKNKSYWSLLFNTYVAMQGGGDKSVDLSAVVSMERAQAAGLMVTNKDNFMLAGLYYNIQQFAYAADLLEKGLRNGKIDSEQKNWELLAACYQQMNNDARATEIFLEAIRLFPKSPNLEQLVGQMYYTNEKREEAYKHLKAAVSKGLDKPGQTLLMISYLALEMKRLEEAYDAAQKAVAADPKNKDAQAILKLTKESLDARKNYQDPR